MTAEVATMPPHDLEAESALLGCWIACGDARLIRKASVEPEDFYDLSLRRIATAVLSLADESADPDGLIVRRRIQEMYPAHPDLIAKAMEAVEIAQNPGAAPLYARIVRSMSALRAGVQAARVVEVAAHEPGASPESVLEALEIATDQVRSRMSDDAVDTLADRLPAALADLRSKRDPNDGRILSWGIAELDRKGVWIQPSDFAIVAARPGAGKTTFLRQWAVDTSIRTGRPVVYLSYEQPPAEFARDAVIAEANRGALMYRDPARGGIDPLTDRAFVEAAEYLRAARVVFPRPLPVRLSSLVAWLYRAVAKMDPAAVVVDYLGLIQAPGHSAYDRVSVTSQRIRGVALATGVPIVAACQLNRASVGDSRPPELHDLRDSGQIEQDATAVLMLHYPWAVVDADKRRGGQVREGAVELLLRKYRHGPAYFKVEMRLEGAYKRLLAVEARAA